VGAEGSPGGGESAADAPVGLAVTFEVQTELDGVDLDEIEVETKDRGDEEDNDVADQGCEEGMAFDGVFVDMVSPFALEEDKRAEQ